jgi:glucose/arabinose dehydrogenase
MAVDQNFLKVKKYFLVIFLILFCSEKSFSENLSFTKIANLDEPWGSSFINENELMITEKNGQIKIVNVSNGNTEIVNHNLNYTVSGQGGLLDILYQNNQLWISYTEDRGNWKTSTSIAKATLDKKNLNFKNIFQANPPIDSGYHFGSRLAIKDNYLFASAGERGGGMIAQDPTNHPGSIIRIHLDGSIPKDNPNFDGKIYASNHGARGGDWFGEIKKGENYGWKILGWGGKNYSGIPIGPKWKPGFTKAIQYWVPSIATSAITIYKGNEFKEWNGHALITSLKDQSLRIRLEELEIFKFIQTMVKFIFYLKIIYGLWKKID